MDAILTIAEAARELKLAPRTVEEKLRKGEIPGRKVGKCWRISRAALLEFVAATPPPPEAA